MIIGPYTIRKTSDIEVEQAERVKAKRISSKLVGLLIAENRDCKALLRRWGLSEGLIGQETDNAQGEALSPPRGRL